jgi:hypothetical protein
MVEKMPTPDQRAEAYDNSVESIINPKNSGAPGAETHGAEAIVNQATGDGGGKDDKGKKVVELRDHDREAEIKKLAYYIWEHRMRGNSDEARKKQKDAAKEYGLDEKAFLEESVRNIKASKDKKIGDIEWTDEAQKIMQDWDYKTAEKIYESKKNEWFKKEGGEEPSEEPATEPAAEPVTPGPDATEAAKGPDAPKPKGSDGYVYSPGDEFLSPEELAKKIKEQREQAAAAGEAAAGTKAPGAEGEPKGGAKNPTAGSEDAAASGAEKPKESDFDRKKREMEKKMDEAAETYARLYSETKSKQGLFRRMLGIKNVEKDPAVEKAREKYVDLRKEFNKDMLAYIKEQHTSGKITEKEAMEQINKLTEEAYINHDLKLQEKKMQYRILADKDPKRGWFSSRVETGFNKFIEKYRKLPWWAKVGTSLALVGSGIGLAAMGAVGAAGVVSLGLVGMRVAGGMVAAKGTQEFLQAQADKFRQRRGQIGVERMKDISNMEGMNLEEKFLYATKLLRYGDQNMDQRFKRMERGDTARRHAGMLAGTLIALGVPGRIIGETGIGSWVKEKIFGSLPGTGGVVKPGVDVPGHNPGGPPMVEGGKIGPGIETNAPGKGMTFGLYNTDGSLTPEGDAYFKQYNIEPFDSQHSAASSELPVGNPVTDPNQRFGPGLYGTETMGHGEFSGDTLPIKEQGNIWHTTRDIFIKNHDAYGYNPDDPKIHKVFNSLHQKGYLEGMGIDADNFDDLSDQDKIKIWAENRTANSVKAFSDLHGGKINDLVHPGDSIAMDEHGRILFGETSGVKSGNLHDYVRTSRGGGAAAAYEPQGTGAEAASAHETAGKRPAFLEEYDQRQKVAQQNYAEKAAAAAKTHEALVQSRGDLTAASAAEVGAIDNSRMHEWMDFIQERIYGQGTKMDWREPASQFRERMLGSFLTSDQPMGPGANVGEQQQYWRAAQELNRRLGPPIGNESTESWMQRGLASGQVKPEDVVGVLSRVVNE